jgi:DNA helicase-2/ATP-dependent DNA helicase PcrA
VGQDLIQELNGVQAQAVEKTDGPIMVIAGAGSGKTRVLTYKVAHLLNKGVDPFNILALTFTNKAAKEMKERILNLVGGTDARNVWMGTFHSIFARVLRVEGHVLGYPSNFTIYDTEDSKSLIKSIIKEEQLDPKQYAANYIQHRISAAKSNLISDKEYNQNAEAMEADRAGGRPLTGKIFTTYNNRLKASQAMDFDDLLFNMNVLLRDYPEVLHKYQQKFKYILVDEYQDTNFAQYLIVRNLAARYENICVVGDDAQSIYAFRGANIQNILNFNRDYPDAAVFKLEQNYRSTGNIVKAANSVIEQNKNQIFKEIWTQNDEGEKIKLIRASTDNEEGSLVAHSIFETKMTYQLPNSDFAILYRTNAQSRSLEEALRKLNIPYRIYGGMSFYKRKEIKDLLSYFRLAVNPNDQEALLRTINYPARGIGATTLDKIIVAASAANCSAWEIISSLDHNNQGINSGTVRKIQDFVMMIRSFSVQLNTLNAFELAKQIARDSGILRELYEDKSPEGVSRFENIEELLNAIQDFVDKVEEDNQSAQETGVVPMEPTLIHFMEDIALVTDADNDDKEDMDKVSLMTIHSAKGLEFPYVFVTGMEENLFPGSQSLNDRSELEEERRLFYVAITRAMKRLTLSYAENRYRWGDLVFCEPSRFLDEINPSTIEMPAKHHKGNPGYIGSANDFILKSAEPKKPLPVSDTPPIVPRKLKKISSVGPKTPDSPDFVPSEADAIQSGMTVEHQKFGQGKVLNVEGSGPNKKVTVFFQAVGQKQLLLQFAKLRIIA